jgi:hypothetical protein
MVSIENEEKSAYELTSNIHWHLFDLSAVELLDLSHHADIISGDEVDGHTLTTETTTTTDTMNVVLTVGGKIVVDDKRDLLNVDATSEKISSDQDSRRARSELLHDDVSLSLLHVAMHSRDGEVTSSQLVGEPVDLSSGVAEDDSLGDGNGLVEIRESIQLPLFLLNSDVELLDAFESEFGLLDQDTDGVAHELGGDLEHILRHRGREEDDLGGLRQELEDVVDLLGETTGQHLVSFVEDEHLDVVGLEDTTLDHVLDTARSSNNDLRTVLKGLHVFSDVGAANAGVAFNVHEVANGHNDLLNLLSELTGGCEDQSLAGLEVGVDLLKSGDGERCSLSGAGLSLSDDIGAFELSV